MTYQKIFQTHIHIRFLAISLHSAAIFPFSLFFFSFLLNGAMSTILLSKNLHHVVRHLLYTTKYRSSVIVISHKIIFARQTTATVKNMWADRFRLGCTTQAIRIILFVLLGFCLVISLTSVIVGIVALAKNGKMHGGINDAFTHGFPITFIVAGSFSLGIAMFGCCATYSQDTRKMSIFSYFLIVVVLFEVIMITLIFVHQKDIKRRARIGVQETFDNVKENRPDVDDIQGIFHCCGTNGTDFWGPRRLRQYDNAGGVADGDLPNSCCEKEIKQCTVSNAFKDNCEDAAAKNAETISLIAAFGMLAKLPFNIALLCLACCVASGFRKADKREIRHLRQDLKQLQQQQAQQQQAAPAKATVSNE